MGVVVAVFSRVEARQLCERTQGETLHKPSRQPYDYKHWQNYNLGVHNP